MYPPAYKRQSIPDSRTRDLMDDFLFGFDVDDEDDREFLADLAIHRWGHDDDIQDFIRLGLRRGVEEWEQAICCALAMQERASPHDGRDVLSFLSTVYSVEALPHDASRHGTEDLRAKGTVMKTRGSPRADLSGGRVGKGKRGKARAAKDSPYWADAPVPSRQEGDRIRNGLEAGGPEKKHSRKRKRSPDTLNPRKLVRMGNPRDDEAGQLYLGLGLGILPSISGTESFGTIAFLETRVRLIQRIDCTSIKELRIPIRDINASEPTLEVAEDNHEADNTETKGSPGGITPPAPSPQQQPPSRKAESPYFKPTPTNPIPQNPTQLKASKKRPPRGTIPSIPFPSLDAPSFGLIQEELANDPFRLLIAVTFLVRTKGTAAIPVFRALTQRYPTPQALADAPAAAIQAMIAQLGLGAVRAATIQRYARVWLTNPPRAGVRHCVRNYAGGALWEIGHMTQGPYAIDSWRIFCRDVLRGLATDWQGGGRDDGFQPEWMRVLPRDKELRACLRWMWMREGWRWDPVTGERDVLPDALRRAVQEGRVGYDSSGDLRILE